MELRKRLKVVQSELRVQVYTEGDHMLVLMPNHFRVHRNGVLVGEVFSEIEGKQLRITLHHRMEVKTHTLMLPSKEVPEYNDLITGFIAKRIQSVME